MHLLPCTAHNIFFLYQYTIKFVFLMTLRFVTYHRQKWHYFVCSRVYKGSRMGTFVWPSTFDNPLSSDCTYIMAFIKQNFGAFLSDQMLDFCYYANMALLIYCWGFPSHPLYFQIVYAVSHGPLLGASVLRSVGVCSYKCQLWCIALLFCYGFESLEALQCISVARKSTSAVRICGV